MPHTQSDEQTRADALRAHGAGESEMAELLAYARNAFDATPGALPDAYPLDDEPHVAAWEAYAAEAESVGAFAALRRGLVQLRFPVAAGMSRHEPYVAATRRGIVPPGDHEGGLALARPDAVRLVIHQTAAGRIPVIVAEARPDFERLVQALTRRNEPDPIPPSMGACIVGGYNNWERVARLRGALIDQDPTAAWDDYFRREVVPRKELYQDRFIILSTGPYSATPADAVGLPPDEWADASLTIRLEHECAHYFTRRVFGSMRNALLDELIADHAGIVAVAGRFRADWLLRFLGVEDAGGFRAGGRLQNYRGTPPLSDGAFVVLQSLVRAAAANLARFHARDGGATDWNDLTNRAHVITAIARAGIERLASPAGDDALRDEMCRVRDGNMTHRCARAALGDGARAYA